MKPVQIDIPVNLEKLKEQYHAHTSKCQEIAKEIEKWGKKTKPNLQRCITMYKAAGVSGGWFYLS